MKSIRDPYIMPHNTIKFTVNFATRKYIYGSEKVPTFLIKPSTFFPLSCLLFSSVPVFSEEDSWLP